MALEHGAAEQGAGAGRRSQAIFAQLQADIMLGRLEPGRPLLEMDLARRFGASQGSVREALLQLQEEGLVHRMPHRGTQVAECREDDARELIRIRHDIECRAVPRILEARRRGPDRGVGARARGDARRGGGWGRIPAVGA